MAKTEIVPDKDALKRVGATVRQQLAAHPNAQKLPTDKAEVYAISYFLNPLECERLMGMIDVIAQPSELYDGTEQEGFRTSYSGNLNPHNPFIDDLSVRIDEALGMPAAYGEAIQGQRYHVGQQFKPHHDFFHTTQEYWKGERKRGGQRSWTAMAFLNSVQQGGATEFPELGLKIAPQPGVLLVWNNADLDGVPNLNTLHAGTPVEAGVKYVLTKWYRTRTWK